MKFQNPWHLSGHKVVARFLLVVFVAGIVAPVCAQDILLSDFKERNCLWLPTTDNHPQIGGVSSGTNGVSFQWSGAAPNYFVVPWVSQPGNAWQTIATLSSGTALSSFTETNAGRINGPASCYRVVSQ